MDESESIEFLDEDGYEESSYPTDSTEYDFSSSNSSLSKELKLLGDIIFKGTKYRRYQRAAEEEIPFMFIIERNGNIINLLEKLNKEKDIVTNFNDFLDEDIKLNPYDFILLFYKVNKDKDKKYLVENFNKIHEVANLPKFYMENFEGDKTKLEERFDFFVEKTKEEFKKIENFYQNIENFKTEDKYEDVLKTFTVDNTNVEIEIRDGDYLFDKNNMKIIFDKIKANNFFSYIRLDDDKNSFYKIFTGGNKKYENFIEYNETVPFEKNRMYLFYEIKYQNRYIIDRVEINLSESKSTINFFEDTLGFIKDQMKILLPDIVFLKQEDKTISGDFQITIDDFDETKLYYLTLFSDVFSEFLFIREDSSVRSLKENIKYYYVGTDQTRLYLNYSVYFNIKKLYNNKYLVKYTSKTTSAKIIKEFMLVLLKLFWYYNNLDEKEINYLSFVLNPYEGVDGSGLGGKLEDNMMEETAVKTKKIEALMKIDKNLYQKRVYVRTCPCQKQPIPIAQEDVKDWENYEVNGKKRNVVLFPPEESTQKVPKHYYVCPDDDYKNFSLRENPDFSSPYPLIPCCNINKFQKDVYKDYDKIRENPSKYWSKKEEYKGKGVTTLKTLKILSSGRKGILVDYASKFLSNVEKLDYLREGIYSSSKSSFLHCLFLTYNFINFQDKDIKIDRVMKKYLNSSLEYREKIVTSFRSNLQIVNWIDFQICMQETYDYTLAEINQLIKNPDVNLESEKFYRFFETFFMVNIFVFVYDKDAETTYLETPNHQYFHVRIIRENLPCIFLLKHKRKYSFNVYEIITKGDDKNIKNPYIFDTRFSKYMKHYISNNSKYFIKKGDILRKNCFNILDWCVILKDYKIISQMINSSGRMFGFSFQASEDEKDLITVFTQSCPPIHTKVEEKIYLTKKKKCVKIFGNNYKIGSNGLWYPVNDIVFGFFVPCEDIERKNGKDEKQCKNYEIVLGKEEKDRELENVKICKYNSQVFLQLIKWLYFLGEERNPENFFEDYIVEDKKLTPESLVSRKFILPMRFPKEIENVKEGIKYLNRFIPEIFDKKIFMYPELYKTILRNLLNFEKANFGVEIPRKNVLENLLVNEEDFQKYQFNKVLISSDFDYWKNNIINKNIKINVISDESICYKTPFVWKNDTTDKIYIVQNNKDDSLIVSLVCCKLNQMFKDSIPYEYTLKNLWFVIKIYYKRYNFGWTFEKLKEYIYSVMDRKLYFKNEEECLDFLIKNKISFKMEKEFSYLIYSKTGDKISITRKYIIDDNVPLEIFNYSDGGHASLIPII